MAYKMLTNQGPELQQADLLQEPPGHTNVLHHPQGQVHRYRTRKFPPACAEGPQTQQGDHGKMVQCF